MPRKNPPTETDAGLNLSAFADLFTNEDAAWRCRFGPPGRTA
jgi:hypothetical protein